MDTSAIQNISILGCGWLGLPLLKALVRAGYAVSGSSRNPATLATIAAAGGKAYAIDLPGPIPAGFLPDRGRLIITLPPRGRQLQEAATEQYLQSLQPLSAWLNEPDFQQHRQVIFTSSISIYGEAEDQDVRETSPLQPLTASARAVAAAEHFLQQSRLQPTILRLAGLIGPGRHPGRFYGGKERPIPAADAPVNLVHLDDVISAIQLVLGLPDPDTYNVCAAAHPAKGDYYTAAAAALGLAVAGRLAGGERGKVINSQKLRQQGWQPAIDDLKME